MPNETAFAGKHPIVPLTFDPTKLKGFSERLIRSHHENNYGGALKNLNRVEEELAHLTKDSVYRKLARLLRGFAPGTLRTRFANRQPGCA